MSDDEMNDDDYAAYLASLAEARAEYNREKAKQPEAWEGITGHPGNGCPTCYCWHKLMTRTVNNVREYCCGECCAEWEP